MEPPRFGDGADSPSRGDQFGPYSDETYARLRESYFDGLIRADFDESMDAFAAFELKTSEQYKALIEMARVFSEAASEVPGAFANTAQKFLELEVRAYGDIVEGRSTIRPWNFVNTLIWLRQLIIALEELYDYVLVTAYRFSTEQTSGWSELAGVWNAIVLKDQRVQKFGIYEIAVAPTKRESLRSHVQHRVDTRGLPDPKRILRMFKSMELWNLRSPDPLGWWLQPWLQAPKPGRPTKDQSSKRQSSKPRPSDGPDESSGGGTA